MGNSGSIDYAALAQQAGAVSSQPAGDVDYESLAQQAGAVKSDPAPRPSAIKRLLGAPDPEPTTPQPDNMSQLKDAAIGAGKSIAKGLGTIGDVATLGLTHLLPGSEKASAGINAKGTALNPTNEDQKYGSYVGDAADVELGSEIFKGLEGLPYAERLAETAKNLKFIKGSKYFQKVLGRAVSGAGEAGTGTLVATGDPKTAAGAAAAGGVVAPAAGAVGDAAKYVRDLYKPLRQVGEGVIDETTGLIDENSGLRDPKEVQPIVQKGIRDAGANAAASAGVDAPKPTSVRDVFSDLADNVRAKHQPVFKAVEDFDPKFADAQADAAKYRKGLDSKSIDLYHKAIQTQDTIFAKFMQSPEAANMDPKALDQAKAGWKQFRALEEVDDAVNGAVKGQRPEIAANSGAKQPAETVDPKGMMLRLNRLYNDGTLETAIGKDAAHQLLNHAGEAQETLEQIRVHNSATKAANVAKNKATVAANRQSNAVTIANNKSAIESQKFGRRAVAGGVATAALGGLGAAATETGRKVIKSALGGE